MQARWIVLSDPYRHESALSASGHSSSTHNTYQAVQPSEGFLARLDPGTRLDGLSKPGLVAKRESLDYFITSSIGSEGLVYFRGGNGRCGWASTLRQAGSGRRPKHVSALP